MGLPLSRQCTYEPLKVENSPSWSINKRHLKVETKKWLGQLLILQLISQSFDLSEPETFFAICQLTERLISKTLRSKSTKIYLGRVSAAASIFCSTIEHFSSLTFLAIFRQAAFDERNILIICRMTIRSHLFTSFKVLISIAQSYEFFCVLINMAITQNLQHTKPLMKPIVSTKTCQAEVCTVSKQSVTSSDPHRPYRSKFT